nr:RNA-directed DNA polymerase (reverse transcriptase) domain containing protein [Haemonchus contortus]
MRGSPVQGRHRGATKLVRKPRNVWKTRVATLNVGTLTGRSYELAEALERRRIDFCAVQETRWSCCKSRDIGLGFKAVLCGGPKTTNGVGIIVSETAAGTSAEFPISVGVHQGSALSPLLFVVVMDTITKDLQKPAPWTLLYADDVMLASEDKSELESQVQTWSDRLAMFGLRLNVKKTEYLTTDSSEPGSIKINGIELTRTTTFKYLGSAIASDGSLGFETTSRVNAAWLKWRSMTGVLCDKNIPERLKSKIYRTVIRPVAIYGAECWPATKEVEARLSVMETKMLRWTAGVTRLDRISNDAIRERFGIAPIVDKMREARLRWYGHTLRAKNDSVRKISLNLDVSGKRPRGRPKQRWLDTLHEDLKAVNIHPDQAFNREKWRQHIRKADPAYKRDKR